MYNNRNVTTNAVRRQRLFKYNNAPFSTAAARGLKRDITLYYYYYYLYTIFERTHFSYIQQLLARLLYSARELHCVLCAVETTRYPPLRAVKKK